MQPLLKSILTLGIIFRLLHEDITTSNEDILPMEEDFIDFAVEFHMEFDDDRSRRSFAIQNNAISYGRMEGLGMWHFRRMIEPFEKSIIQRDIESDMFNQIAVEQILWGDPIERSKRSRFNDPCYMEQWYLRNDDYDYMNIQRAWDRGLSGRNVTICIVDDGLDHDHEELRERYNPYLSFDFNDLDDELHDPTPTEVGLKVGHGTKCAGVAAAQANNKVCGVGVAYGATISGFRLLDGPVNSLLEARALSHLNPEIDIKSNSWGPTDNGMKMEAATEIVQTALNFGVTKGRLGKGILFVWAAGNGGSIDHCGADGLSSNRNVFSITSVNQNGRHERYTEAGTNIIAAAYVGCGSSLKKRKYYGIFAPGINNQCTANFAGTSAAAPLASGIFALLLESNPELTYRDVMHIVVRTARIPQNPDDGWITNGAGFHIHDHIGFGTLDADAMIELGTNWQHVPQLQMCNQFKTKKVQKKREPGNILHISWDFEMTQLDIVKKIEHVVISLTIKTQYRGGIRISLRSPSGTPSVLLDYRRRDDTTSGLMDFPFTTNRCWGENPLGVWNLEIWLKQRWYGSSDLGEVKMESIAIWGTE